MRAPALLRRPAPPAVASALVLSVLLAGCGAADDTGGPAAETSAPDAPQASSPGVGSPSPPSAEPSAGGALAARPAPGEPPAALSEGVPEVGSDVEASLSEVVDAAVADLAGRLGVDPGAVEVLAARPVTWPDAALGCPEEGMTYAQVLTDGAAIELGVDGARYRYHAGGETAEVVACNLPSGPATDA